MKFAANTKLEGATDTEEDWSIMQEDLHGLQNCSNRNRVEFCSESCKVIILEGKRNFYKQEERAEEEKEVDVSVT